MIRTLARSAFAALAVVSAAASLPARSDTLVIPAGFENVDADSSIGFPFGVPQLGSNLPYRFQQIYAGSEFGSFGDVITIDALRFRVDQPSNPGVRNPITVQSMEVRLATTTKSPDGLDTGSTAALDSNLDGGDTTLGFAGTLAWDPCDESLCTLPAFDLEIALSQPFAFDPATQNLIVEFLNLSESFDIALFDATASTQDGLSHVREVINPTPPNDHLFPNPSSVGLVTQFVYTVPEAGSEIAGGAAMLGVALLRRRRA